MTGSLKNLWSICTLWNSQHLLCINYDTGRSIEDSWPVELFRWSCQSREDQSNDVNFIFSSLRNVNVVRLKFVYLPSSVIHYSQQYLMSESTKPVWNLFDKTSFNLVWTCLLNHKTGLNPVSSGSQNYLTSVKASWTCFIMFSTSYWN
jgi:hypothetical protein